MAVHHVRAGCWQEVSVHCSVGFFIKLLENSHDMATRPLLKGMIQENVRQKQDGLESRVVILVGRSVPFGVREDV